MLVDEATIIVKAGDGGDGLVGFRREKYVPKGGPDGGDGGDGGDIYLVVSPHVHTLFDYARLKHLHAEDGQRGMGGRKTGKDGSDLELKVPPGTIVAGAQTGQAIIDLTKLGDRILLAKGGKGGRGNYHFATATHQTPREAEAGIPGVERLIKLELKLIADVGIIGLPNAGKSTLLAVISAARPKIADYPFTTLEPNLGVVSIEGQQFIVADIPGLIEGAAEGKGLGHKFLRHVERCQILWHLIDANSLDPVKDYKTVRAELERFSKKLMDKKELVLVTKAETVGKDELKKIVTKLKKPTKKEVITISAAAGIGVRELLFDTVKQL